ncbi:hypothetical protein M9Y10_039025 [Tritrichomonas musculus]|uniref:Uncharacterized protein n=1 Tax=Tritrichomonas musculus TaxID=1915356 RepID=A0ABR2KA29_9EUKA
MNRISHEYPHEFSEYLEGYLHDNYSEMVNQEILVHDLRSMIKELSKQDVASDISFLDFSQPDDFDYLENINFDMFFDDLTF